MNTLELLERQYSILKQMYLCVVNGVDLARQPLLIEGLVILVNEMDRTR